MPGLLARGVESVLERRSQTLTVQRLDLRNTDDWRWLDGGGATFTGRPATDGLMLSAVYASVRVLANAVSTLPLKLYRELDPDDREVDPTHPLYGILKRRPNPEQTNVELWSAAMVNLALRGNHYLNIVRNNAGVPIELWPLHPDRMTVFRDRDTGDIRYLYTLATGEQRKLARTEVCHLRGLADDGMMGYSVLRLARESIGLGLAAEEFAARRFGNDSTPRGVLQVDSVLTPDQAANLKTNWEAAHAGLENSHRVAVLENGVTWQAMGLSADDAQMLGSRQFQVTDVARWFGVPPHKIADLTHATFSNIEEQNIEWYQEGVLPWLERIEARLWCDLFWPDTSHYAEFQADAILRGNSAARWEAYTKAWQIGAMSTNEIRRRENLNRIGAGGDIHAAMLNMTELKNLSGDETGKQQQVTALVQLIDAGFDAAESLAFLGMPQIAHPFPPTGAVKRPPNLAPAKTGAGA